MDSSIKESPVLTNTNSMYMLYYTSNYKPIIQNNNCDILTTFVQVICEYMSLISEKSMIKRVNHYRFVFSRGIDIIIQVFTTIFCFTKNLELTFYHSQKAYYFYIEFIEQMSDDNVRFLNLSSRDAMMFVYKKTIFELNEDAKKNMKQPTKDERVVLENMRVQIHIFKSITLFAINHSEFKFEEKNACIHRLSDYIKQLSESINHNRFKEEYSEYLSSLTHMLVDTNISISDFFNVCNEFVNKLGTKKKINAIPFKMKLYDTEIIDFVNENQTPEIVNWLFS